MSDAVTMTVLRITMFKARSNEPENQLCDGCRQPKAGMVGGSDEPEVKRCG